MQRDRGEGRHGVHEAADRAALFGHLDEEFTGLAVLEETDSDIAFVAGDIELVVERDTGVRQAVARRLVELGPKGNEIIFQFDDPLLEFVLGREFGLELAIAGAVFFLVGDHRRGALGSVAVDGNGFEAELPTVDVSINDVVDRGVLGQVDRLGDGAGEEWLRGGHHVDVRAVAEAALPAHGLKGAIKDADVFGAEPTFDRLTVRFDVFDGVVFVDVADDRFDLRLAVAELLQGGADGLVDDFQHAAAGEELVFDQGDVGLDAGRVAVHEEPDGSGRGVHGDLGVAVALFFAELQGGVPDLAGLFEKIPELIGGLDVLDRVTVELDDLKHGIHVVRGDGLFHAAGPGVFVAGEGPGDGGDAGALFVGVSGHDGGDRAGEGAALGTFVAVAVAHDERAEVGVAEAEGAEDVAVFRDVLGRVLPGGAFAGVPLLDGRLELHAGVATDVRAFGDFAQEMAGVFFLAGLAVGHADSSPFASLDGGVHEFIGYADGEVLVLIHDRAVGFAIKRAVITLLDEGPGFALLAHFGFDEFFDVGVPILERVHLGRAAGFAAAFDHAGHLVVNFEEGKRTARFAAAA